MVKDEDEFVKFYAGNGINAFFMELCYDLLSITDAALTDGHKVYSLHHDLYLFGLWDYKDRH